MLPCNFNKIRTDGERAFLFNETDFNAGCRAIGELQKAYDGIHEILQRHELPTSEKWLRAVADEGADGLRKCVLEEAGEKVASLGLPSYIARSVQKAAPQEISAEVWGEADAAKVAIDNASAGLPFKVETTYDEEAGLIHADEEAAKKELMKKCQIELTPELRTAAEVIVKLSRQVRELELLGMNARSLVGRYALLEKAPDTSRVFNDVVFQRHQPGQIAPTDIMPLVHASEITKNQ